MKQYKPNDNLFQLLYLQKARRIVSSDQITVEKIWVELIDYNVGEYHQDKWNLKVCIEGIIQK